jgi:hypothetical protein
VAVLEKSDDTDAVISLESIFENDMKAVVSNSRAMRRERGQMKTTTCNGFLVAVVLVKAVGNRLKSSLKLPRRSVLRFQQITNCSS